MTFKNELQNIISGNEQVRFGENIQATLTYLRTKKKTTPNALLYAIRGESGSISFEITD